MSKHIDTTKAVLKIVRDHYEVTELAENSFYFEGGIIQPSADGQQMIAHLFPEPDLDLVQGLKNAMDNGLNVDLTTGYAFAEGMKRIYWSDEATARYAQSLLRNLAVAQNSDEEACTEI